MHALVAVIETAVHLHDHALVQIEPTRLDLGQNRERFTGIDDFHRPHRLPKPDDPNIIREAPPFSVTADLPHFLAIGPQPAAPCSPLRADALPQHHTLPRPIPPTQR